MITQFSVCQYSSSIVVILTNTVFNEVESILVAPLKPFEGLSYVKDLQIPCEVSGVNYYVDLLDIATVSKRNLKLIPEQSLKPIRTKIKYGIDLLIDGF
ncbi:CcdB family protein [Alteromonas hispanica]|uniref:Uncharacterized protein n=1 Tax=Alteromonas hispanica TaxID=315421 RepID=A0A6L9MU48_9ALTE|nr:CcdB family protein [Alteromonas hispanica]NDW21698.1 hypothetical protein [Alteromonas hispanica]